MAIGRIAGQMLYSNLERQGVDLAFDSNLIYLDVNNRRVGIKSTNPQHTLDINGNVNATNYFGISVFANTLVANTNATIASNTTISSTQVNVKATTSSTSYYTGAVVVAGGVGVDGNLNVRGYVNTSNLFVNGGNLTNVNIGNITFVGTTIGTTYPNNSITLDPTGTGYVVIASNVSSTTYQNGALVVDGGVGIAGNLNVNGTANLTSLIVAGATFTNVNLGNITISDTTITTVNTNDDIVIQPTGSGLVLIDTTTALVIPTGNTIQEPGSAPIGSIRYNTDINSVEFYNGSDWVQTTPTVDSQTIIPNGTSTTYTLTRSSSTSGTLVIINGVMQLPSVAYTVSGNQITFVEVPLVTDIIDIRFVAAGEVASGDLKANPNAIYVNTTPVNIDSFDKTLYRTAKYVVQASDTANSAFQSSEILMTHNGTTSTITVYGSIYTASNLVGFTTSISSNQVLLKANSVSANCAIKIQKTYIGV